jgi:hypothetical protein
VEPCAAHKKDDVEFWNSTVAPACGQADETAKKFAGAFPAALRMTMNPLLATKSFTAFNSVSKLMEKPVLGVFGLFTALGAPFSSFVQALARQATQATEKLPVNVVKNSFLFIRTCVDFSRH